MLTKIVSLASFVIKSIAFSIYQKRPMAQAAWDFPV